MFVLDLSEQTFALLGDFVFASSRTADIPLILEGGNLATDLFGLQASGSRQFLAAAGFGAVAQRFEDLPLGVAEQGVATWFTSHGVFSFGWMGIVLFATFRAETKKFNPAPGDPVSFSLYRFNIRGW